MVNYMYLIRCMVQVHYCFSFFWWRLYILTWGNPTIVIGGIYHWNLGRRKGGREGRVKENYDYLGNETDSTSLLKG